MHKCTRLGLHSLLLSLILTGIMGCSAIRPYNLVDIGPGQQDVTVLMPPSDGLSRYDTALAVSWIRTVNYCTQVRRSLVDEIEQRKTSLQKRQSVLLLIGSMAGMATAIYSGTADNPSPKALVPLGLVSGASLTTALPSLSRDERLTYLQDKLERIRTCESDAIRQFNRVEALMVDIGITEDAKYEADSVRAEFASSEATEMADSLGESLYRKYAIAESLSAELRVALATWASECK